MMMMMVVVMVIMKVSTDQAAQHILGNTPKNNLFGGLLME